MAAEIDLFEWLELSPGPPEPDEAALKAQLAKKKQEWGRNLSQGGQKAKREAQRKLELLPQLLAIVADPGRRRQAAGLARARLEAAAGAARRELEATIGLLKKSSLYCDQSQLEALVQRFAGLGRQEVERCLRAAGVSLERRRRASAAEPIDAALAQAIAVQLAHLAKKNLYAFLGLPPQSPSRALQEAAKSIYRENQRLGRSDPVSSAANRLAGLCSDRVFVDEDSKKRYDAYLATAAMESLKPDLDFAGLDKILSPSEMEHFLEIAERRGVDPEAALLYIERYAEERGWTIQSAAGAAAPAAPRGAEAFGNLRWQRSGQAILLTWDWPRGVPAARVCLDYDSYKESADRPGISFDLTAAEYRRDGAFVLRQPARKKHYFSVFARGADASFSAAARIFAGLGLETTIRYRLSLKRSLFGRNITGAQLELHSEDGGVRLPALVVVAKRGVVPISPRDGRVLLQIPAAPVEKGLVSIGIPPADWSCGCYIKVFFEDASAGEGLRLLPAGKEELFLG